MSIENFGRKPNPVKRGTLLLRGETKLRLQQRGTLSTKYREKWVFPIEQPLRSDVCRRKPAATKKANFEKEERRIQILIINSSEEIAACMTEELEREFGLSTILYAPTLTLARWLLKKRRFDLVVTSPMLPDGSVASLRSSLHSFDNPPDLLVVGEHEKYTRDILKNSVYQLRASKSMQQQSRDQSIKSLGADLRNDFNNPLQEIVAMVFVAKVTDCLPAQSIQALNAIERAAKNMSDLVWKIEEKIMVTIQGQD